MYVSLFGGLTKAGRTVAIADSITAGFEDFPGVVPTGYTSPFTSTSLEEILFKDIFGEDIPRPISRTSAMKVPPLARGRNRVVATISGFPLVQMTGDPRDPENAARSTTQAPWLTSTAGPLHPGIRMAWTVDDLFWYGWSLWSRDTDFTPGARIERRRWRFDTDGHILVDDQIQRHDQIILFGGIHEGVLAFGDQAIRDAQDLYSIVRQRLRNPAPNLNLNQTAGVPLTNEEIDELIARWATARAGANGGVGFTGTGIELQEIGAMADATFMVEARNAAAVDLARIAGVSASVVDATAPKASLNYETTEGRNLEFVDSDLQLYTLPIQWRLSMDDVVAPGDYVTFDKTDFTAPAPSPTGPGQVD